MEFKILGKLPLSAAKPGCSDTHIETVACVERSFVGVKNVDLCIYFELLISATKITAVKPILECTVDSGEK